MTDRRAAVGEMGEGLAARLLRSKGMKIVGRRIRFARGELDIVAKDGNEWVFVEVKTRSAGVMGDAASAMTRRKAGRMERAVREYVHMHALDGAPMRCDLVAVDIDPDGGASVNHYPGAITF